MLSSNKLVQEPIRAILAFRDEVNYRFGDGIKDFDDVLGTFGWRPEKEIFATKEELLESL